MANATVLSKLSPHDHSGEANFSEAPVDLIITKWQVSDLSEVLVECSSKWEQIAYSLKCTQNEVQGIWQSASLSRYDNKICLYYLLSGWAEKKFANCKPPTLKSLEEALRSNIVGLGAEANSLRGKLLKRGIQLSKDKSYDQQTMVQKYEIVSQTRDTQVTDDRSVLLEVKLPQMAEVGYGYTWYKNVEIVSESECILCLPRVDLTKEGVYKCEITIIKEREKIGVLLSEPILLTVITPFDQHKPVLIHRYAGQPEVPNDTWPPVVCSTFINLALIKQEGMDRSSTYGRNTIQGDADDILKDKESIQYRKVFSDIENGARLLIEGRPGSGKTTLVHKVSRDWARGKLKFNHCKLLLLIHLRGFLNDPNVNLKDLIGCYYKDDNKIIAISEYANERSGLGLYFILDGLDEYVPHKSRTYIFNLIMKANLPRSVVIVVSRPAAVAKFRPIATKQVEVVGFLCDQISEYIKEYQFSVKSKCEALHRYLDEHPNVRHMCYLPIHVAMVCYLFDYLDVNLPQTETEIYAEFTKHTLFRSISRQTDDLVCLDSIESLPAPEREVCNMICKLAWELTISGKQAMLQKDVRHFFDAQNSECLGLITIDIKAVQCGFDKIYTFLHLTFQEFLAAYYISRVQQRDVISKYGNSKRMQQVWKFYCGLVKKHNHFKTLMEHMNCDELLKVQCSFESQQPHTCDCVVESNSLSFKDKFLTNSDFTAIGYVISNVTELHNVNVLVLESCNISMEGISTLYEKAAEKLSLVTTLCFHGHNCGSEQLKCVNSLVHKLPSLETLDITNTGLDDNEILALINSLHHSHLQIFKVGPMSSNLSPTSMLSQTLVIPYTSNCKKKVTVWFNECTVSHFYYVMNRSKIFSYFSVTTLTEMKVLSAGLKMYGVSTTRLSLIDCNINDDGAKLLAVGLKSCIHLNVLELPINLISDVGANALSVGIESCTELHSLNLSCNRIGDDGAMAIANAVRDCKVYLWGNDITNFSNDGLMSSDIHTLCISYRDVGDAGAIVIANSIFKCNSNVSINLHTNNIGNDGITDCISLHTLDISHNIIRDKGAIALSADLKFCNRLHTMDISYNIISGEGAIALGDGLKHCSSLHVLDISHNIIGRKGTVALCNGLNNCNNLQTLNISYNNIGSEGTIALSGCLRYWTNLHTLDIGHNNIGKKGVISLCFCLKYCNNLHILDISNNTVLSEGAIALSDGLVHCTKLYKLVISNNIIGDKGATALSDSLKYLSNLYTLDISRNNIWCEGAIALSNGLKHSTNLH